MAKRNLRSYHVQPRTTIEDEQTDITILTVHFGVDCGSHSIVLPSLVKRKEGTFEALRLGWSKSGQLLGGGVVRCTYPQLLNLPHNDSFQKQQPQISNSLTPSIMVVNGLTLCRSRVTPRSSGSSCSPPGNALTDGTTGASRPPNLSPSWS